MLAIATATMSQHIMLNDACVEQLADLKAAVRPLEKMTRDKLVAMLAAENHVGIPSNVTDNPLASFLRAAGLNIAGVSDEAIVMLMLGQSELQVHIELAPVAKQLMVEFHSGHLLALIRSNVREMFMPAPAETGSSSAAAPLALAEAKPRRRRASSTK